MASCSLATLQAQACANGFLGLTDKQFNAVLLVELANLGSNALTLDQLQALACSNKFKAVTDKQFKAAWLQLLCNLSDGTIEPVTCVSVIPQGANYGQNLIYSVGTDAGRSYQITWGINEDSAVINGVQTNNPGIGIVTSFVSDGTEFVFVANTPVPDTPVTSQLCEVTV